MDSINEIIHNLTLIGFELEDIYLLLELLENGIPITRNKLVENGLDYRRAALIIYMHDIMSGRILLETKEDLIKHLKKINGEKYRIDLQYLPLSMVSRVKRKAVITGITDSKFNIYNSELYPIDKRTYDVKKVTSTNVYIETKRRPILRYGEKKFVPDVIEIVDKSEDNILTVCVNRRYVRLCNRYIIVASFRKPEIHHGLIELICIDGSKLNVYAKSMHNREVINITGGRRIYDWGLHKNEIKDKLISVAGEISEKVFSRSFSIYEATQEYKIFLDDNFVDDEKYDINDKIEDGETEWSDFEEREVTLLDG